MEEIIPISDLQTKTKHVVDRVKNTGDAVIITQRGRPAVMMVNYEDYEGLLHTLDEMNYPDWQEKLLEAKQASKMRRGIPLEALKKKLQKARSQK